MVFSAHVSLGETLVLLLGSLVEDELGKVWGCNYEI